MFHITQVSSRNENPPPLSLQPLWIANLSPAEHLAQHLSDPAMPRLPALRDGTGARRRPPHTPPPTHNQSAGPAFASSQQSLQPPPREQTLADGGEEANEGGEHLNLRQYFLVVNGSRCGHST